MMAKKDDFSSVAGKVVVITGGASGIGRSMCELFARNGAKVVMGDIQDEKANKVLEEVTAAGGEMTFVHTDTSVRENVERLINTAVEKYGKLHVLCNNAGVIPQGGLHPVHETKESEVRRLIEINTMGYFYGIQYAVRAMLKTESRECAIINVASACGLRANEGFLPYDISKHAIVGMTKTAAMDYAKHDITVNAICPGAIRTGIHDGVSEERLAKMGDSNPNGRMGRPEEIAYLALFLATDMARMINGAAILVDAGQCAGNVAGTKVVWAEPDPRI